MKQIDERQIDERQIKMKTFFIIFILSTVSFAALASTSLADVTIVCNPCYVNSCQCVSNCTTGTMYVYNSPSCVGIFTYSYNVTNGIATWQPPVSQNYALRILCDDGNQSSCATAFAGVPVSPTTTTTSGGGGGGTGCVAQGNYCYYTSQCCSGLSCVSNNCSSVVVTATTTTAAAATSTTSTETATTETTTTSITTTFPNQLYGVNIYYWIISLIVIIWAVIVMAYFFFKRSRNNSAVQESKKEYEKLKDKWQKKDQS